MKEVHERTVYRWIRQEKVKAEKVDGCWQIELDDKGFDNNPDTYQDKDMTTAKLKAENDRLLEEVNYLRKQLDDVKEERERSDTIVMQLSRQIEKQTLMLEDLRNRSVWTKVKTALGFALP